MTCCRHYKHTHTLCYILLLYYHIMYTLERGKFKMYVYRRVCVCVCAFVVFLYMIYTPIAFDIVVVATVRVAQIIIYYIIIIEYTRVCISGGGGGNGGSRELPTRPGPYIDAPRETLSSDEKFFFLHFPRTHTHTHTHKRTFRYTTRARI